MNEENTKNTKKHTQNTSFHSGGDCGLWMLQRAYLVDQTMFWLWLSHVVVIVVAAMVLIRLIKHKAMQLTWGPNNSDVVWALTT